jgi:iron complex outermembrane receptor protein
MGKLFDRCAGVSRAKWLGTVSLFAFAMGPAWAQEAEGESGIPRIVVTAEFREADIQNTPLAITALTGDLLQDRGIQTVSQLAAPNVNVSPGSSAFGPLAAVYIRGVGQYDSNFAYEPGVGVYVDDVYYGVLLGSDFQLADLDRVEILRGPQGTNSGRNSIGGSMKLFSRRPTGADEGYIEVSTGRFDRIDVRGAYDLSLVEGQLAMRLSGIATRRDGHVRLVDFACEQPAAAGAIPLISSGNGCDIGDIGGENVLGLRAALLWTPSDNFEVYLTGDVTEADNGAAPVSQFYANNPAATLGGVPYDSRFIPADPYVSYGTYRDSVTDWALEPKNKVSAWGVSGDITWRIGEHLTLRSITAYRDLDTTWNYDQDNSPIRVALVSQHNLYEQFSEEVRLSGALGKVVDWTIGGYYFDSDGVLQNRVLSGVILDFVTNDPVESTSVSGFGQVIAHILPDLNLTGGIRYTDDEKSYTFSRLSPTGGPAIIVGSLTGTSGSFKGDRTDYRAAIDYRWTEGLMTYFQFSTGYKGGGINPRPFIPAQVVPFSPETVKAFEAGFKSDLFNRRVRLNMAGFYNKYKDIILIDANGAQGFPFSAEPFNAGDADVKGVELEIEAHPVPALTMTGSVGYLDFDYKRLAPDAVASGILISDVPPLTPEWKAEAAIAYAFNLGEEMGTLTPRFDVQYTSKVYTDPANHVNDAIVGFPFFELAGYTTANARLTYESGNGKWQASLAVTNLTDKTYYTNGFAFLLSGTGHNVIARPREWAFTIRRRF